MKAKDQLRVVLYEPSGIGGVCHYTHQLADSLAQMGQNVTVVTHEGYELSHLKKTFRTFFLFKRSWINGFLLGVLELFNKTSANRSKGRLQNATRHEIGSAPGVKGSGLGILKTTRLKLTLLKGVLFCLLTRPHLIHLQGVADRKQDYYFARLLKKLGFRIIYTAHDLLPHDKSTLADRESLGSFYQLADRVIVHSESDKAEMSRTFGIDCDKICVVPHGSNSLFYSSGVLSKEAARKQIGLDVDGQIILFFGNVRRYKGLEYLIEAFKAIKDEATGAMLLIVGSIYEADPEDAQYHSELIRNMRGQDRILCINEYVPLQKVSYYFLASDLIVLPYVKTYTSGVLLTAYAAGRPVIVTNTGALKEVVEDGSSGYVVPAGNVKALSAAILKTIRSSDRLEGMGRYAKYLADTRYSWSAVASRTMDVYRSSFDATAKRSGEIQRAPI